MKKIQIANFLLTRRCNLACSYCRISGNVNYKGKPAAYPSMSHYIINEKSISWWIDVIDRLLAHNKDMFFILYGGEPTMYKITDNGLAKLINYLKSKSAAYTIISDCSPELSGIRNKIFSETGPIRGWTASVDPGFEKDLSECYLDEDMKSHYGFKVLCKLIEKGLVIDPVAEMTVSNHNIHLVIDSIKVLTEKGICTDLTVLDIAFNNYYDFSTVTDESLLVQPGDDTKEIFHTLEEMCNPKLDHPLNMHMPNYLIPKIFDILPATLDCKMEDRNVHNITIDADGSMRLCLRIRGIETPRNFTPDIILDKDGKPTSKYILFENSISVDKLRLCEGCNWTCSIMSSEEGTQEMINNHDIDREVER